MDIKETEHELVTYSFLFLFLRVFQCIAAIKQVNESITNVEARHNVTSSDVTMAKDRLNFGLVEVVYEWARNKVFNFRHFYMTKFNSL